MAKKTESERLTSIETKLDIIIGAFANHLKHHWAVELLLLSALLGGLVKWLFF